MNILDSLSKISSKQPNTLEEQRQINTFLAGEGTSPDTSEANLLSLLTLDKFYDGDNSIKKVGQEESRYLKRSIDLIGGDFTTLNRLGVDEETQNQIHNTFGRDLTAAIRLSKVLKSNADKLIAEDFLDRISEDLANENKRKTKSVFKSAVSKKQIR
jgi:hypothetical protein